MSCMISAHICDINLCKYTYTLKLLRGGRQTVASGCRCGGHSINTIYGVLTIYIYNYTYDKSVFSATARRPPQCGKRLPLRWPRRQQHLDLHEGRPPFIAGQTGGTKVKLRTKKAGVYVQRSSCKFCLLPHLQHIFLTDALARHVAQALCTESEKGVLEKSTT